MLGAPCEAIAIEEKSILKEVTNISNHGLIVAPDSNKTETMKAN